jgi:hypothetical protein
MFGRGMGNYFMRKTGMEETMSSLEKAKSFVCIRSLE